MKKVLYLFMCLTLTVFATTKNVMSNSYNWYVSVDGNDNNPGTQSAPFRTIQSAINRASSGHSIKVSDGAYNEQLNISQKIIKLVGNPTNPQNVTINGSGLEKTIKFYYASYSEIYGFTITGGTNGAIYSNASSELILSNLIITNNHTSEYESVIQMYCSEGTIQNTLIYGNNAYRIIYLGGCGGSLKTFLYNNTIVNNSGNSCIYSWDHIVTSKNNIIRNPGCQYEFSINEMSSVSVSYCNVRGGTTLMFNDGFSSLTTNNIVNNDPLFVNPSSGDYRLSSGSPDIDAGDPDEEWNDVLFPPCQGTERNDIGAYGWKAGILMFLVPSAPTNLRSGDITENSFKVTWNTVWGNVGGYKLYINNVLQGTSYSNTSATITGCQPETSYSIKVVAYNSAGNSEPSESITVRTLQAVPTTQTHEMTKTVPYEYPYNLISNYRNNSYMMIPHAPLLIGRDTASNFKGRGCLTFDLSDIPANARIDKAELIFDVNRTDIGKQGQTKGKIIFRHFTMAGFAINDGALAWYETDQQPMNYRTIDTVEYSQFTEKNKIDVTDNVVRVTIDKFLIVLKHNSENTDGMELKNVKLGIKYTIPGKPTRLTNFVVGNISTTSCNLKWDVPLSTEALTYKLYVNGEFSGTTFNRNSGTYELQMAKSYSMYITAVNSYGESLPSDVCTFTSGIPDNIKIEGPDLVCSTGNFTISNLPSSLNVSQIRWSCSSNLAPTDNSAGTSKSFRATGNGDGYIDARLIIGDESFPVKRKYINIGPPDNFTVSGPKKDRTGGGLTFSTSPINLESTYVWTHDGTTQGANNQHSIHITFTTVGIKTVRCYAYNACGSTSTASWTLEIIDGGGGIYSMSYPNPASNILNIELDTEKYALINEERQMVSGIGSLSSKTAIFDIRLYDNLGNMLRRKSSKGERVKFSVSDLPSGIYFIHIYDGTGEKPSVERIIIER
ncbi:MAG: fibronectin type III domain-containing protein [Bacteroidales bacterium]|jgi:hypothetical protein|nr:fibronectin type III domain-containing protein [Bacteroidales bacterium]